MSENKKIFIYLCREYASCVANLTSCGANGRYRRVGEMKNLQ